MSDYISRDELIKALESDFNTDWDDYASKNNFDKDYIDGVRDEYDDVLTIICKQPAAEVQPTDRWINAQTNPPIATDGETSDYVLVLRADGRQCVCYYVYDDDDGNYWCSEDEKSMYDIDEVTHWQPLPEPPKQ